jgi:transposase-like protein
MIVACDGLKGLPDAVGEIWPLATVQLCVVHYPEIAVMPIPHGELVRLRRSGFALSA